MNMQELVQEEEITVGLPSVHKDSYCMSQIGFWVGEPGSYSLDILYADHHTLRIGETQLIINAP